MGGHQRLVTARPAVVVVDTNVFGSDLVRRGAPLAGLYRPVLEGRSFVLSFQTVAELRFGALRQGWGAHRLDRLDERVAQAHVVWAGPELLDAYVELRVRCEKVGHALAQSHHDADRWIAATAVRLGIPLVSHDSVFEGAPGLMLERNSA